MSIKRVNQDIQSTREGTPGVSCRLNAKVTKALLACGFVAGPLFMLVVVIQILFRPGFDLGRHPISLLSLGDIGGIQIANFVISGLLIIAFAIGIRQVLHPGRGSIWGPFLVGMYGAGLIIAGVFVPDPSLGFPPGTPEGIPAMFSLNAILHGVGFMLAFGSLTLACLVFALRDTGQREYGWAVYSVATAMAALAFILWPGQQVGISVRYFIAAAIAWTWTSVIAARLIREYSHRSDTITTLL